MGLFGCTPDKVASTRQQYMTLGTQNRTADIVAWSGQLSLGVNRTRPYSECEVCTTTTTNRPHTSPSVSVSAFPGSISWCTGGRISGRPTGAAGLGVP
jgi:hypothetical protein